MSVVQIPYPYGGKERLLLTHLLVAAAFLLFFIFTGGYVTCPVAK